MTIIRRTIWLAVLLVVNLGLVMPACAAKHAVLMYDVGTKQVIHQEHGTARRYPASLTKMMTLYLLFEELRLGNVSLDTKMTASRHAAAQPQTNLSLRRGDKISVKTAIKALVVRSANDVAVVVAEHLGGSVDRFAGMMTRKARELGMYRTTFKNPHGLPNRHQVTTAKDMALLGAALRHDFPQYYHYFSAKRVSFKGRSYRSHNRVLDKLPGVDGIKTGYINASGFNLVSSLKRGDVNIVAVVLGGRSSRARDREMVKLLDKTYARLAKERRGGGYQVAFAPSPQEHPFADARLEERMVAQAETNRDAGQNEGPGSIGELVGEVSNMIGFTSRNKPEEAGSRMASAAGSARQSPTLRVRLREQVSRQDADNSFRLAVHFDGDDSERRDANGNKPVPKAKPAGIRNVAYKQRKQAMPPKNTLNYQLAALNKEFPVPSHIFDDRQRIDPGKQWAVQIGVYSNTANARRALSRAARQAENELKGAIAHVEHAMHQNRGFHRARLKNLSHEEASSVCQKLTRMSQDCFVTQVN